MNNEAFDAFMNNDFKKFSNGLFSLSAIEFNLLATVIGFAITPTLTTNEQNSLGNFFTLIGQILMTANAQNITLSANEVRKDNFQKGFQTTSLEEEILLIKKEISKIINNNK